jgi:hypothetical protein
MLDHQLIELRAKLADLAPKRRDLISNDCISAGGTADDRPKRECDTTSYNGAYQQ